MTMFRLHRTRGSVSGPGVRLLFPVFFGWRRDYDVGVDHFVRGVWAFLLGIAAEPAAGGFVLRVTGGWAPFMPLAQRVYKDGSGWRRDPAKYVVVGK